MKTQKLLALCLGMVIILVSCEGSKHPTEPISPDEKQTQLAPTRLSDDTLGSGIAVVIAAVGDSITYGDGSWTGGYPRMLEEKLRATRYNVIVRNNGIPGAHAWEINADFSDFIEGADIVLIMVGTNDLGSLGTAGDSEPVDYIESMIDRAQRVNIIPIVSTVTPQFGCLVDYDSRIRNLNSQIYALAAWQDIQLVDNYQAILDYGGSILYSDCVHFNDQGYNVIAEQFYNAIIANTLIRSH
jgi:lysophospholipase L1-like esterase